MWDSGVDRRKFPRAYVRCLIYMKKKDNARMISTHTENISVGGMCVILNEDLGLFQNVAIELYLKEGASDSVKCAGTVVWVVKKHGVKKEDPVLYDTGIEFADISDESRKKVSKVVEKAQKG